MNIIILVGTRPNFMKASPFIEAINEYNKIEGDLTINYKVVHTGQHYDDSMSKNFFSDFNFEPDINLNVKGGDQSEQVGRIMMKFERALDLTADYVVVFGDTNSALACSIVTKKNGIKLVHIEAGLRSNDWSMPEEINRVMIDRISDLLLTPDLISQTNLTMEGRKPDLVGNIMIDTLQREIGKAEKKKFKFRIKRNRKRLAVVTLHRPANVDSLKSLEEIIDVISNEVAQVMDVVWILHPRTGKMIDLYFGSDCRLFHEPNITVLDPMSYHGMLKLNKMADLVITDSGGLQEECLVLGTPCLILRNNTERPVVLFENGGNAILGGCTYESISSGFKSIHNLAFFGRMFKNKIPEVWDGRTAERCINKIISDYVKSVSNR